MKSLFRIATRTLGLGLLVAVCLVVVVTAKGIDPEVLVSFRSLNDQAPPSIEPDSPAIPLQFAQVEPTTRLDAPASVRTALGGGFKRTVVPRGRGPVPQPATNEVVDSTKELPQLPPLPRAPRESGFETEGDSPEAEILESPPEMTTREDFEVALGEPSGKAAVPSAKSADVAESSQASPLPGEPPVVKPAGPATAASKSADREEPKPDSAGLTNRLDSLKEQLQKLTAEQERQRISHQSWLESAQLLQQQKLQGKLDEIEATLRDLKAKPDRLGKSEPYIQRLNPKDRGADCASPTVVREERPGTDGEKRFSIESHQGGLRELLDTLTQKANLNLVLSINVEGNVEMSLQNATAEEALKAIQNTTGYVVEKSGQKVYVRPGVPMGHQREEFLPPIVKEPTSVPAMP
ncbi:MAG: hypothetical protein JWN70_4503 [Planctomycetaceae bacterium]|nr:hypothetical protein [Planctomycetaceae bacterium]